MGDGDHTTPSPSRVENLLFCFAFVFLFFLFGTYILNQRAVSSISGSQKVQNCTTLILLYRQQAAVGGLRATRPSYTPSAQLWNQVSVALQTHTLLWATTELPELDHWNAETHFRMHPSPRLVCND